MQSFLKIAHGDAGQGDHADLGDADLTIAVDHQVARKIHRAPDLQTHFVTHAEHIVTWCRQRVVGGIGLRSVEQIAAIHRQQSARGLLYKGLKLVRAGGAGGSNTPGISSDVAGTLGSIGCGVLLLNGLLQCGGATDGGCGSIGG